MPATAGEPKGEPAMENNAEPGTAEPGHDTATGYEDKSFGQAVNQDQELVEDLLEETDGDVEESERRFGHESAGSPAIARQHEAE